MTFIFEKRQEYYSEFKFKCKMCGIVKNIQSEKENSTFLSINEGIASRTIAIGIDHSQLAELSATIDIPYMSSTTYFKVQTILSKKIHDVAMQEMLITGEEEKK
ncbi:YqaJ domain-containing protein [Aphis craccivora]|uniref:YqaJ domain-containing protein n=1 Tax=Aphis craccivora TaxID=307492 RepID=A0A6G0W027_APHCR|nr:YqaJ domain-containing protein [Aphis craccivora]